MTEMPVRGVVCTFLVSLLTSTGVSAAEVTVAIDYNAPSVVSRMEIGVTHTHAMWENGHPDAVARVKKELEEAKVRYQNQHIMGWGANNPEPSPGVYSWSSLDRRLDLIRSMADTIPVITFCTAPGWMKASGKDWNMEERVADDHVQDFANLCRAVALRYPDVEYFQVWNEFKGYWIKGGRDVERFTVLYNAVYDAVRAARPNAKIGGPYLSMGGRDLSANDRQAVDYWYRHGRGSDFFTFDGWLEGWPPGGKSEDWMMGRTGFFGALVKEFRTMVEQPLWVSEFYGGRSANPQFTAANHASCYFHALQSGARLALLWDGVGLGQLFSRTQTAEGGQPTPHYSVVQAFNQHFGLGTQLYQAKSSSNDIEVLASRAKVMLINKRPESVAVRLEDKEVSLKGYEVRVLDTSEVGLRWPTDHRQDADATKSRRQDGRTASQTPSEVTIYPFPAALPSSETYRVTAGGQPVHVIRSDRGDIAWFACSGPVDMTVEVGHEVKHVDVRPLRHGLQPALHGRTLRFRIPGPVKLSVEINGDTRRPLFLFADAPEQNVPEPGAPGVRRFAGGRIHDIGELTLASGQSLYLEPGAVVRGTLVARSARNIRVFGRGLFDAASRTEKKTFLRFTECAEVRLEDFLVLGAYGWTLVPWQCEQVRIANIKLVSWRDNDDGIDICASRNVRVEDCFLRTKDDCIALKAHGDRSSAWDVRDVRIARTVFWNAEWGNAMEIGFELRTARVSDVVVQDCDIIRVEGGAVLSVHNADFATVEGIRYEDIRVEDASDKLLELRVGLAIYSQDCPRPYNRSNPQRKPVPGGGPWLPLSLLSEEERAAQDANRGRIRNVVFRNIALVGDKMPVSLIQGHDARRPVENVTFEQVRFHDQVVRDVAALRLNVTNGVGIRIAE